MLQHTTPHHTTAHRRRRIGASAIEFALLMPVFVLVLAGLMEMSWVFFQDSGLNAALRAGCRAGALTPATAMPGPEEVTEDTVDTWMGRYNQSCTGSSARCSVSTVLESNEGETLIRCSATLQYESLTGLIPVPDELSSVAEMRLESP